MMKNDDYVLDALYCIPMPPSLRRFARIMKEKGGFEGFTVDEREENWDELVDVGFYWDYYIGTIKLASQRYGKQFRNTPKKPLPNGTYDQPSMVKGVKQMDDKYRKMWQSETNRDECPLIEITWDGVY